MWSVVEYALRNKAGSLSGLKEKVKLGAYAEFARDRGSHLLPINP